MRKMEKKIYDLQLHEMLRIDDDLIITRVPGGWIYNYANPRGSENSFIFVPFNNEFQLNHTTEKPMRDEK